MAEISRAEESSTARLKCGEELRIRREAAKHTQKSLANAIVCSASLIAHIEAGRRKPSAEDAERIDQALGTDGFFARFLPTLSTARFAAHYAQIADLEKLATCIQEYGAALVPGLLQIEPYARAIFRSGLTNITAAEVDRRVVQRLERAKLLEDPDRPVMWVLLDEHVLRRVVGGPTVMAAQLRHIAQLTDRGRIRLHVLPFSAGAHALSGGSLTLMKFDDAPPVAYLEGVRSGHLHDEPARVAQCQAAYDLALGDALSAHESLALITCVAEEYERAH
ncbi:helix-turn-helix domain-containing protein [Streptomyces sp. NPDC001678]|uniref:helix-turn-helix domain-containing protein n=1 Tax=Streptomyces sp. NPDC001678 TaxID=3364599 RepID=UPI0036C744BD